MEKITPPTLEIVRFGNEDVIAASGIRLAGFMNGTQGDATLTVGGTTYGKNNWNDNSIVAALLPGQSNVSQIVFIWGGSSPDGGNYAFMGEDIAHGADETTLYYTSATNGSYSRPSGPSGNVWYFYKQ